jgi:hypothetical protein
MSVVGARATDLRQQVQRPDMPPAHHREATEIQGRDLGHSESLRDRYSQQTSVNTGRAPTTGLGGSPADAGNAHDHGRLRSWPPPADPCQKRSRNERPYANKINRRVIQVCPVEDRTLMTERVPGNRLPASR